MTDGVEEEIKRRWETSTPQWTCRPWEDLKRLKGISWCLSHDLPLEIVALDGENRICRVGAERDSYEFSMQIQRRFARRGIGVCPRPWAKTIQEDIDRGNGHLYSPDYERLR